MKNPVDDLKKWFATKPAMLRPYDPIPKAEMLSAYNTWAAENKVFPLTPISFGIALTGLIPQIRTQQKHTKGGSFRTYVLPHSDYWKHLTEPSDMGEELL